MHKKHRVAYVFLFICALFYVAPLFFTFASSFAPEQEIKEKLRKILILSPTPFTLDQYLGILIASDKFMNAFWRSLYLATTIAVFQTMISFFAGYVFAKVQFRFKSFLFALYMMVMFMPFQVTLLPNFLLLRKTGLFDTQYALILPSIFAPLGVFLMNQFIKQIHDDIIQSVRLETNSTFLMLFKIILPCILPGMMTLFILSFSEAWNMVEGPLIFLSDKNKYPLALLFQDQSVIQLQNVFAASVVYMSPAIVLFVFFKDQLLTGLEQIQ